MDQITRDRIELARRDPNDFVEFCFVDKRKRALKQGRVHRRWQDAMGQHRHLMIGGHRRLGKTTQVISRTIYELGNNVDEQITFISANDDKAHKRVGAVRRHIERNEKVHLVFPGLEIEQASASRLLLRRPWVDKDASVEGYGVLSAGTGDRSGLAIFDDPCDRRNALTVPALRKAVKVAYRNDWINLLGPEDRSWYLFNPWHADDLTAELIAAGEIPVVRDFVKPTFDADGRLIDVDPVCEEMWNRDALMARYRHLGQRAFLRGYCGMFADDADRIVDPDWFRYGWPDFNLTESVRIQTWDGAAPYQTVTDDPDYVACLDGYASPLASKAFVADAWHGRRMSLRQQVKAVLDRMWTEPYPAYVGIEQIGESALCSEVAEHHAEFPEGTELVPIKRRGQSKTQRLESVSAIVEHGAVLLAPHLNPNVHPDAVPLVDEVVDPDPDHDDLRDVFVDFLTIARRVVRLGGGMGYEHAAPELESSIAIY